MDLVSKYIEEIQAPKTKFLITKSKEDNFWNEPYTISISDFEDMTYRLFSERLDQNEQN